MECKIYIGGLMRCCTQTLREAMAKATELPKEGDTLSCQWCKNGMVYTDGWRWSGGVKDNGR